MLTIKKVVARGTQGYNGKVDSITVANAFTGVVYDFSSEDGFQTWADKVGIKVTDKDKKETSLKEIRDRKVITYEVNQNFKEVFINKKEEIPTNATKMVGLVCGEVVFCYVGVEGNETTVYRPKPSGDWYELLPQVVQDLIIEQGIRPLDYI
ncbi:hypothetical protein P9X10_01385 [Bacillus cereus]|nr:hypothetical protein [Bacillus cereus]